MIGPDALYRLLMSLAADPGDFDSHAAASILALSIGDCGLDGAERAEIAARLFPGAADLLAGGPEREADSEEQSVRDIMMMYANGKDRLERLYAAMIARRCKWPHHLWQDLGLRDRGELSRLMRLHFVPLVARNAGDMKWKKFLYRMVCGTEGFTLCAAPSCGECDDQADCFGPEAGRSRLGGPDAGAGVGA